MKILCLTTFLDGKDRFEQGDQRTVGDVRGARFCANGWAEDLSGAIATTASTSGSVNVVADKSVLGVTASTT